MLGGKIGIVTEGENMTDLIVFLLGVIGSGFVGYGIRALRHPAQLRDKRGRYTKRK